MNKPPKNMIIKFNPETSEFILSQPSDKITSSKKVEKKKYKFYLR